MKLDLKVWPVNVGKKETMAPLALQDHADYKEKKALKVQWVQGV